MNTDDLRHKLLAYIEQGNADHEIVRNWFEYITDCDATDKKVAFTADLLQAQRELPAFRKVKEARGYSYAPLDAILHAARPVLAKHKLCLTWEIRVANEAMPDDSLGLVVATLSHTGGYSQESYCPIYKHAPVGQSGKRAMNPMQEMGSGITYAARYAVQALLGVSTETDTDADTREQEAAAKKQQEAAAKKREEAAARKPECLFVNGQTEYSKPLAREFVDLLKASVGNKSALWAWVSLNTQLLDAILDKSPDSIKAMESKIPGFSEAYAEATKVTSSPPKEESDAS